MSRTSGSRRRTAARMVGSLRRDLSDRRRLLLAAKTAFAAALAWLLAPFLPFVDPQYAYYAPLGVLVTMYPTVARSASSGLRMLVGLVLGIGLGIAGTALVQAGVPAAGAVAFVAGVGVLFGGLRALGPGQAWVAIAALFVLLVGGGDGLGEYSISYLVHVGFGVLIGVLVNLVLLPPLYLTRASRRLSELREEVAERMREMADAAAGALPDEAALAEDAQELAATVDAVRDEVHEAEESRRSNPRGRRRADEDELNYRRLRALERIVFLVRDLAEGLDRSRGEPADEDLARAIRNVADLIAAAPDAEDSPERLERARRSVATVLTHVDRRASGQASAARVDLTIVDSLQRMIDTAVPFVRDPDPEDGDRG